MRPSTVLASDIRCHLCDGSAADIVPGYEAFRRVTSDCKPWPRGGQLCVCRTCGCVQKVIDPMWRADAEKIYDAYTIYHQSEGAEQSVFEDDTGQASSRSARLLERLQEAHAPLPETGRLLDIGCGNGALLRTFAHRRPRWSLVGTELNGKCRREVESIEGVEALYTCQPEHVPGTFDLVTLVHLLEHVRAPGDFLTQLRDKLGPGGLLLIEIPDYLQNPFDLLIADHCSHFTVETVTGLIQNAGLDVLSVATDWVPKELTVVARKTEHQTKRECRTLKPNSFKATADSLQWLEAIVATARIASANSPFGLFGTSIAATWLLSELEDSVSFFVDEDPHRAGKTYMNRPVYAPHEVPRGAHVLIALPTALAEAISRRLAGVGVTFHLPPPHNG